MVDVATLPIAREEHDGKGRYLIAAPGGATAEMSYSRVNDGLIIIDHTEVPDAFRGTGTGRRLLERLIADARAAGTRIVPLCPFAKAQFDRHPEWADLLETRLRVKPKPAR
ncbi:MAG: GNAT family N-acetyltransferase [Roseitalea porphyridii]|uniref:GNAT family N-acetyltransferase n=1 Tax=Roseitalea porphyridii TaxID=1852022 RepID=UPI0032ED93EA